MPGDLNLARQWVDKAKSDLLNADNNLSSESIPFDTVCFHCQQAAEKLLKGFLVFNAHPATRTHDLLLLLNECLSVRPEIREIRDSLLILNPYAVEVRYPDDALSPTMEDAKEARSAVSQVTAWMEKTVPELF